MNEPAPPDFDVLKAIYALVKDDDSESGTNYLRVLWAASVFLADGCQIIGECEQFAALIRQHCLRKIQVMTTSGVDMDAPLVIG